MLKASLSLLLVCEEGIQLYNLKVLWTVLKWIIQICGTSAMVYFSTELFFRKVLNRQIPAYLWSILMFPILCLAYPFVFIQSHFTKESHIARDPEMPIFDDTLYCDYSDETVQEVLRIYGNVPERFFKGPEEYASYRDACQRLRDGHDVEHAMDDLLFAIDNIPGS